MSAAPSSEQVLRQLFWKLLFRGRAALHAAQHGKQKRLSLKLTMLLYAAFGLLPAFAMTQGGILIGASILHSFTFLFASLTLASNAGTMLFLREEAEILLHRPIRPEQLLRAKVYVLLAFSLLLALALNLCGMLAGTFGKHGSMMFLPAHALSTLLLMTFSAALIVLVYNLCLRWFGRERFENLLTTLQTVMSMAMVFGSQLMPYLPDPSNFEPADLAGGWAAALPPIWFGSLDALLCGAVPLQAAWLPAALGVLVTMGTAWLAFGRLGAAYGTGLQRLNEASSAGPDRLTRRLLPKLVALPPLRWWLRDPVQRHAFVLTSAYLVRDRETKLKLYPGIAPMLMLPLMAVVRPGRHQGAGPGLWFAALGMGYLAIVPILALQFLQRSEHWRAAEWFRMAPLEQWSRLFHGARKAVLWWLALPTTLLVGGILAVGTGSWQPVALVVPTLVVLPLWSMLPGLWGPWVPLSLPNEEQRQMFDGCLTFVVVTLGSMVLAAVGMWMDGLGYLWVYCAGLGAASVVAQRLCSEAMRARRWRVASE